MWNEATDPGIEKDINALFLQNLGLHQQSASMRFAPNLFDNGKISLQNVIPVRMQNGEGLTLKSFGYKPMLRIGFEKRRWHTLAPHASKGDLICLFIGAGEPYLLREEGKHYKFVGLTSPMHNKPLWEDCETEYRRGRIALRTFDLM